MGFDGFDRFELVTSTQESGARWAFIYLLGDALEFAYIYIINDDYHIAVYFAIPEHWLNALGRNGYP